MVSGRLLTRPAQGALPRTRARQRRRWPDPREHRNLLAPERAPEVSLAGDRDDDASGPSDAAQGQRWQDTPGWWARLVRECVDARPAAPRVWCCPKTAPRLSFTMRPLPYRHQVLPRRRHRCCRNLLHGLCYPGIGRGKSVESHPRRAGGPGLIPVFDAASESSATRARPRRREWEAAGRDLTRPSPSTMARISGRHARRPGEQRYPDPADTVAGIPLSVEATF